MEVEQTNEFYRIKVNKTLDDIEEAIGFLVGKRQLMAIEREVRE